MLTPDTRSHPRASFLRVLRHRDYRRFTIANLMSVTGTWMQVIAQNWLVLRLTGEATAVGITIALQALPSVLFGVLGGVVADRWPKQRVLIVTQLSFAVLAALLGLATITGMATIGALYFVALCLGVLIALDGPSNAALGAELVGDDELADAIALGSVCNGVGRIAGMSLGGALVALCGPGPVFLANGVSYLAVVAVVARLPVPARRTARPSTQTVRISGLRDAHRPAVIAVAVLIAFVVGAFGRNYQVTMAAMCEDVFKTGASGYGTLSVVFAIGALCGGVAAGTMRGHSLRLLALVALIGSGLEVVGGLAPSQTVFAATMFLIAIGAVVFDTAVMSIVQLAAGAAHRGRAIAVLGTASMLGVMVGGPTLGALADHLGGRASLTIGGLIVLLATLAISAARYLHLSAPTMRLAVREPALESA